MNVGTITTTFHKAVATLCFWHPMGNSFTSNLLQNFVDALENLNQNEAVKVIILKSEGEKIFCSGASFDELLELKNREDATRFFSGFAKIINALRSSNKIILGDIHGKSVGGGVGIIAACDFAFASKNSLVKLSELAIGIGPYVIEPAITRRVGVTAFAQLALQPKNWQTATWAYENKLFSHYFETPEEVTTALENLANELALYDAQALSSLKKTLWQDTENWDTLLFERAKISANLALSDDTKEILKQFKLNKNE